MKGTEVSPSPFMPDCIVNTCSVTYNPGAVDEHTEKRRSLGGQGEGRVRQPGRTANRTVTAATAGEGAACRHERRSLNGKSCTFMGRLLLQRNVAQSYEPPALRRRSCPQHSTQLEDHRRKADGSSGCLSSAHPDISAA